MTPETWQQLKTIFQAAIELKLDERAAFLTEACAGDAGLRSRVEKLLASHDGAGAFLQSPAAVDAGAIEQIEPSAEQAVGKRIGPYEIIRELGHGGMGTVYLAVRVDDQYRKQVAIKLVNRGMDTDVILRRFMMERQILANLEHPNIARLLEGGSTEDGLPYFVMEYIEGEPINEYCDAQRFTTAERLELFREVCAALQYAHQNLVVHRDIKPSNILVTAEGVPKLLDFGIAKLLSPDWAADTGEATASMVRLMTPEYASPEQLRGLTITTASDVYSLGVVLYELLSGHHPYHLISRRPEEVIQVILQEEPLKPSVAITRTDEIRPTQSAAPEKITPESVGQTREGTVDKLRRRLSGDLDNIVLKALRKEPERRYASVQEFAEDIRRHLEGLPVTASPATFAYRTGKFIQRNKAGALAAALIVITLFAATALTVSQAHVARRERAKAERRFVEIRKLSNSLITEVQSSLTTIPGTTPTQRLLAQKSLEYLDSLSQDEDKDVGEMGELASAYINVGSLQSWTLYDTASALRNYQKAVAIQRRRILLAPNDPELKKDLTFGLFKLGEAFEGLNRREELLQTCGEIIELHKALITAAPENRELLRGQAGSYERRGVFLRAFKHSEQAEADFRSALALVKQEINLRLAKDTARDPQARVDLSFAYIQQGAAFTDLGEWQNAAESYQTGGQIAEAVYRENPELPQARRNVASSHNQRGDALDKLGDYRGALEDYRYALKIVAEARARNANSSELRYTEARYTLKAAIAQRKAGEVSASLELVRKGLGLAREYIVEDRSRSATIVYGSELFEQSAEFLAGIGRQAEAIAVYQEALQNLQRLAAETSPDSGALNLVARYDSAVGDLYAGFDSRTKAVKATSHETLLKARNWYQQSFDTLKTVQQRNVPVFDKSSLDEVAEKLSACEAALMKSKS